MAVGCFQSLLGDWISRTFKPARIRVFQEAAATALRSNSIRRSQSLTVFQLRGVGDATALLHLAATRTLARRPLPLR
jgi:hypothetical protein